MKQSDFMVLLGVTLLTLLAAIYGFSSIPSPAKQRDIKIDHKRVSDLGELQASIQEYARDNKKLPETLNQVTSRKYDTTPLSKTDPETGDPYEYIRSSEFAYQLCATFKTDTADDENSYDSENYLYSSYKTTFSHGVGRYCFPLTVDNYILMNNKYNTNYFLTPSPTYRTTNAVTTTPTPIQWQ